MKTKERKIAQNTYIDQELNSNLFKNQNNNKNFISKNKKIEEIPYLNNRSQFPINYEEYNTLIDPNSINPAMLGNKFTPIINDYYPQGNMAGLENFNNKLQPSLNHSNNPNFNFNFPTSNLYGIPAMHGLNCGIVPNPYYYGNTIDNNNLQNLQQSGAAFYNFQPPFLNTPFVQNSKIPIRTLNDDEIIYVNYKQHYRILHRREKRKKLNLQSKKIEEGNGKPKYIHESRHRHAMNRMRNKGGRFLSKNEMERINENSNEEILNAKENSEKNNYEENGNNEKVKIKKINIKRVKEEKKDETFTDPDYNSVFGINHNDDSIIKNIQETHLVKVENLNHNIKETQDTKNK